MTKTDYLLTKERLEVLKASGITQGDISTLEDNDFMQTLAEGGLQVGELAKLYFPGGHDICPGHSP